MSAAAAELATMERWDTQAELWTSFASLLRSYAAAHGLNSRHQAVVEVSADSIMIRVAHHWTSVVMQQGRVTVDQDWSEPGSLATARYRAAREWRVPLSLAPPVAS